MADGSSAQTVIDGRTDACVGKKVGQQAIQLFLIERSECAVEVASGLRQVTGGREVDRACGVRVRNAAIAEKDVPDGFLGGILGDCPEEERSPGCIMSG